MPRRALSLWFGRHCRGVRSGSVTARSLCRGCVVRAVVASYTSRRAAAHGDFLRPAPARSLRRRRQALEPRDPDVPAQIGASLFESGQARAGVAELEKALRMQPGHPAASHVLPMARDAAMREPDYAQPD